ncbi:MAG: coproporphyrinogen-III oxidase family protein [Gemmatimonadota bacterium]
MDRGPMNPIAHLYLHVPFCRQRCPYCDFAVSTEVPARLGPWQTTILGELAGLGGPEILADPLETLLVGGGTPSVLGPALTRGIRTALGEAPLREIGEWTVETNPEDLTPELLHGWRREGVTRLNVGIQSTNSEALRWLGRAHTPEGGREAAHRVAATGFDSWGVDLLYGLPPSVDPNPEISVEWAIRWEAPHISVYELIAEPETLLGERVAAGLEDPANEDQRADQYLRITALLEGAGYQAYEMNAFARPSHASRHARAVLEQQPFLGLGPGAHSWIDGRERVNLRGWREYVRHLPTGPIPESFVEKATESSARLVRWASRLRLREGLAYAELPAAAIAVGRRWDRAGWAVADVERLRLTPEGWLRLDALVLELDDAVSLGPMEGA